MSHHPLSHLSATDSKLAGLGPNLGYRFDGDQVYLNAMFSVLEAAANSQTWQLQLWAYPVGAPLNSQGFLVGAAVLPPIVEIADPEESFEVGALSTPPPGAEEYSLVLALVAIEADRHVTHDFSVFPMPQKFIQPQMIGNIGFNVTDSHVHLSVEQIRNPRSLDTVSGTLALELWALPAPYFGGPFQGAPIAGVQIAPLPGQWESINNFHELPYNEPPEGTWYFVIMLREWTPAGFVTRDSTCFLKPVIIEKRAVLADNQTVETITEAKSAPKKIAVKKSAPKAEKPALKAEIAAPAVGEKPKAPEKKEASALVKVKKEAKPAAAKAPAKKAAKQASPIVTMVKETPAVSVNTATLVQIAEIKGMPAKVAEGIVAGRPFASLDELSKVKGFGQKLLEKLRPFLKL